VDDRGIGDQEEVDLGQGTRLVWNSVKSTLSSVEPQGGGD